MEESPAVANEPQAAAETGAQSPQSLLTPDEINRCQEQLARLADGLNSVILGQRELVDLVLICLVSQGHMLLEGLPGLGKTEFVRSLASL